MIQLWAYDTTANQWTQMSYCDTGYITAAPFAFSNPPKNQADFNIYPRPNAGNFVLNSSYPIVSYEGCNMNGKEIYNNIVHTEGNSINVDLSLPDGLYLVRIISNEGSSVKKILVTNN